MRSMNPLISLLATLTLMAACTSCHSDKDDTTDKAGKAKRRIGNTCMDLTNPFFKLIANVMEREAEKHGFEMTSLSGDNDPARQNNQVADFVAQGYDAIFLNPVDSISIGEAVKKAHAAGIPVFTYDVQVEEPEANKLVKSHIGSDNYQGGQLAGESMMKVTGDSGEIGIIGCPELSSCRLRAKGFRDYLKAQQSKLKIVSELNGGANMALGNAVATDMLQAHQNLVAIFAVNDPSALGAHSAIVKADRTDRITVIGFDASPAGKQAVFEKKLHDSPQQFPRKMAIGTVEAFVAYLNGEALKKNTFIPCRHYYHEDSVNDESRTREKW